MTQFLPPNLLALFAAREPLKFLPPPDKLPSEKNLPPYSGVSAFLTNFEDPKDCPPPTRVETKEERKERQKKERAEQVAYKLEQDLALWDPNNDPNCHGDPFKTLFCARINYDTSESKLRREFDVYGPVKRVQMVMNKGNGKPRGYAFIEFEHERDMHAAYKYADGKKIDGRRVLVDVERGRTVKGWRPRRLGGGLGNTRRGGSDVNIRHSGRDDGSSRDRELSVDRRIFEGRGGSSDRRPRSRSRERERRRRSRSRDRERERRRRERRRSPKEEPIVKKELMDEVDIKNEPGLEENKDSVRKHTGKRSRSPRDRSRRSRSRDRNRRRRSRSRDRRNRREEDQHDQSQPYIKEELDNLGEYGMEEQQQQQGESLEGDFSNPPANVSQHYPNAFTYN